VAIFARISKDRVFLSKVTLTFISRGFSAFGSLALNLVLGRLLGASGVGLYVLAFSVLIGLGVLARFGMDSALLKFAGIAFGEKDGPTYRCLKKQAFGLASVMSLGLACCLYFGRNWLSIALFNKPELVGVFAVMAVVLPFYAHIYLQAAFLKALSRPALAPFFEIGSVSFIASAIVLFCYLLGVDSSPISAGWSLFIGTLVCFAGGRYVLARTEINVFGSRKSVAQVAGFYSALPNYAIMSLTSFAVQWGSVLLLGAFASAYEVGLYSVAYQSAFTVNFILLVFNSIIAPQFAYLYQSDKSCELEALAIKSTSYMTLFAAPVLMFFVLFPEFFLGLFGEDFKGASPYLVCLAIAQFVNVATGSVGVLLIMTGGERCMRKIVICTGCVSLALSLSLCPHYGAWGATIATVVALVIQNLMAAWWVNKRLGIMAIPGMRFLFS
jgi:O-antigen/teichoic acid export membrane protein